MKMTRTKPFCPAQVDAPDPEGYLMSHYCQTPEHSHPHHVCACGHQWTSPRTEDTPDEDR